MSFETVIYEKQRNVGRITLNRPQVINAYNIQMRDDLYEVLGAAQDDPDVRAILLAGAGDKGFCAGADLTEFGTAPSQVIARQTRWERDVWGLFLGMRKPMVAALHGYVIGSGVEMALLCDILIASEDAVFGMPEVALGMIPAAGGTQTLPRAAGPGDALSLLLTNGRIDCREALRMGIVQRVVLREALLAEAGALAEYLASLDTKVVFSTKDAMVRGIELPIQGGLDLELRLVDGLISR